jgi:GGDEF domain-containing protein
MKRRFLFDSTCFLSSLLLFSKESKAKQATQQVLSTKDSINSLERTITIDLKQVNFDEAIRWIYKTLKIELGTECYLTKDASINSFSWKAAPLSEVLKDIASAWQRDIFYYNNVLLLLPNRRHLIERLEKKYSKTMRSVEEGKNLRFLARYDFKMISNEKMRLLAGDEMLKTMETWEKSNIDDVVPPPDIICATKPVPFFVVIPSWEARKLLKINSKHDEKKLVLIDSVTVETSAVTMEDLVSEYATETGWMFQVPKEEKSRRFSIYFTRKTPGEILDILTILFRLTPQGGLVTTREWIRDDKAEQKGGYSDMDKRFIASNALEKKLEKLLTDDQKKKREQDGERPVFDYSKLPADLQKVSRDYLDLKVSQIGNTSQTLEQMQKLYPSWPDIDMNQVRLLLPNTPYADEQSVGIVIVGADGKPIVF